MTMFVYTRPQLWILFHHPSGSSYAVEYGRLNGKVVRLGQGFVQGNVVSLDGYRQVKQMAQQIFGSQA